jgi:hypothetical protein
VNPRARGRARVLTCCRFASPKQRKLDKQVDALKDALESIRVAAGGEGGKPNAEAASEAW